MRLRSRVRRDVVGLFLEGVARDHLYQGRGGATRNEATRTEITFRAHGAASMCAFPERLRERDELFKRLLASVYLLKHPHKFANGLRLLAEALAVQHQLTGLS